VTTRESGLTTSARSSAGSYLLTWDVAVTNCVYIGVTGSNTAQTTFSDTRVGFLEAVPVTGQANQVRVFTTDKGGSQSDRAFSISVMC
jgi:hypothetical protein